MAVSNSVAVTVLLFVFLIFLLALMILDTAMIVSLLRTGDERRQLIVWKSSASTLLILVMQLVFRIVGSVVRSEAMTLNPFIQLSVAAIVYFIAMLYFRRKYGG